MQLEENNVVIHMLLTQTGISIHRVRWCALGKLQLVCLTSLSFRGAVCLDAHVRISAGGGS